MDTCVICFEQKKDVSKCTLCMESGISCHECDKKWVEAGNDKNICSVLAISNRLLHICNVSIILWNSIS